VTVSNLLTPYCTRRAGEGERVRHEQYIIVARSRIIVRTQICASETARDARLYDDDDIKNICLPFSIKRF